MSLRGEAGWQALHAKALGKERWLELYAALKAPVSHVALVNAFLPEAAQAAAREERKLQPHEDIPMVCTAMDGQMQGEVVEDEEGLSGKPAREAAQSGEGPLPLILEDLMPVYLLDGASVLAALSLGARPGDKVLDLCAAPGGKSLVIATTLFGKKGWQEGPGRLVCNEISRPRGQRLQRVLSSFLPAELVAPGTGRVSVSSSDAAAGTPPTVLMRQGPFDRVLVDAPCTSDRHLARQGREALARWASGAVKANAERQLELLRSAAALVRRGGIVLYSTCALSEQENDGVVAKFLKKAGQNLQCEPFQEEEEGLPAKLLAGAEATTFGHLILPDRTPYGPMYIARLRRT